MQKNKSIKNLFYLALLTSVVVVIWIASSIYYGLTTSTIPEDTRRYSTPITPTFDTETLSQIGTRIEVPVNLSTKGRYLSEDSEDQDASASGNLIDEGPIDSPSQTGTESAVIEEIIDVAPQSENTSGA
jgi:hypothetical protein